MKFSLPITLLAIAAVDAAAVQEDKRFCNTEGQACHTVARAADAFTNAIKASTVTARDNSPAAVIAQRQLDELALAIAASQADPIAFYTALSLGAPLEYTSTEKREAAPQWCTRFPGQPCWKRSSSPQAAEEYKRCAQEGSSCWQAKRAAEAVINTIQNSDFAKREAAPQWCTRFPGQPCWKRDASPEAACNAPNGACTKAARDAHAMYNVARYILDTSA
ncbi:mat-specific pheromone precursor encoded by the mfm protein [Cladorrhinum samala]|uniref:Mat-specific pheromone encoded by the mfm protein n=1 Tax=Cladorrhinum samala TaxID=585594 RepID=A0AAV9HZX0_9PEZI|nr:mat-specific pheromone precursor encoded by the mfm protein [Cladorrhinum samala]